MRNRLPAMVLTLLLCLSDAASARTPNDLQRRAVATISGATKSQGVGYSVAEAGDVNGDSVDDLLVRPSPYSSGRVLGWVVFGGSSAPVDVTSLGDRGFQITLPSRPNLDDFGFDALTGLSSAGDLNEDGLDDVLISAPWEDANGRTNSGSVFVVFGKEDSDPVDVSALGTSGVRIDGAHAGDKAGLSVASADVDGDDLPDVVVGAPYAGLPTPRPGIVYVLFGHSLSSDVDLAEPFDGYSMVGPHARQAFGAAIAGAGDSDGDGFEDLIIGAPSSSYRVSSGAYLVRGKSTTDDVDLGADDWRGWQIRSSATRDDGGDIGISVAGRADVNGDDIPDVVIGAPDARTRNRYTGAAYVVFGTPHRNDLSPRNLGDAGFKIVGPEQSAATGTSVALAPDIDGDGLADVLVGSPDASAFGSYDAGRIDVIFGQSATVRVDLGSDPDVLTYVGDQYESAGFAVAYAGDFSGSTAGLAVGAPSAAVDERYEAGIVYLVPAVAPGADLPPRATLLSYSARQQGVEGSYCWEGTCDAGSSTFPSAERASKKNAALIRFGIPERPEDTALTYYRSVDQLGRPVGMGRSVDHRVRLIGRREASGYEVFFHLPNHRGDAYLVLKADWAGNDSGHVTWMFHLRLDGNTYTDIKRPPDADLRTGQTRQDAAMFSYSWSQSYVDGFGSSTIADALGYGFPRGKRGANGARARIRIHNRYRPDHLRIAQYRRVKRDDDYPTIYQTAIGSPKIVRYRWRAVRRAGRVVAHDAIFRLPRRGSQAYYEVRGRWRFHGTAPWQFHIHLHR